MIKDDVVKEVQRRLNLITVANGYPFDNSYVFRNPEDEPSPDLMPCVNIFEMEDSPIHLQTRSASTPPISTQSLRLILEMWYKATSQGAGSVSIMLFLKSVRTALFSDGITLGNVVKQMAEVEVSRVFRPAISNRVFGIGVVLELLYVEDFSNL